MDPLTNYTASGTACEYVPLRNFKNINENGLILLQ